MLIRTQILFPKDTLDELRELAGETGLGLSETVRKLIQEKIGKIKKMRLGGPEVLLKMAKNAYKGKVPKDLGSNDEYLYSRKK